MKHFVGTGKGTNKEAVNQAIKDLYNPTAIVFFAYYKELEEVSSLISEKFKNVPILGIAGSTYHKGECMDSADQLGKKKDNTLRVIGYLDESDVEIGIIKDVKGTPILSLREFDAKLKKLNPNKENTVCMTFNTIEEENVVSTLKPILNKYKISMMGGTVGGFFGKNAEPYILLNGEKYYNSSAYVLVKNKVGKIKIYRQDIYEQEGDELLTVTKVEGKSSRQLKGINGKRVDKVYSEKYDTTVANLKGNMIDYSLQTPLGAVVGDAHYIISIAEVLDDGSITTFKKITEGETIAYMKVCNHDKKEKELVEKIKKEMPKISFVFSVDCIYRALYYSNLNYLDDYLKGMSSLGTHVGIIGVGEQNEEQHFNQTMVCVVFE